MDATTVYGGGGQRDGLGNNYPADVGLDSSSGAGPRSILSSVILGAGLVVCPGGACWTDAATGKVMRFVACSP